MKKIAIALFMIVTLFSVSSWAYDIKINTNVFTSLPGGEFAVTSTGLGFIQGAYTGPNTKNVNPGDFNFESFCLEYNEHFSSGGSYYAEINPNNAAITGGVTVSPFYDVISVGTAWLYQQFITGSLEKYNYGSGSTMFSTRSLAAGELQRAIWFLEDEGQGNINNYYVQLAITHFNSGLAGAQANYTGTDVGVLNVWENNSKINPGGLRQDQLIGFPVPEPSTLLFLGAGLLGMGFAIRRRKS